MLGSGVSLGSGWFSSIAGSDVLEDAISLASSEPRSSAAVGSPTEPERKSLPVERL